MKKVIIFILTTALLSSSLCYSAPYRRRSSDVHVQSYTRSENVKDDSSPLRIKRDIASNQEERFVELYVVDVDLFIGDEDITFESFVSVLKQDITNRLYRMLSDNI